MDSGNQDGKKDNKKKTSVIDIVKSRGKGGGAGKEKLLITLLAGVLLLLIAMPVAEPSQQGAGQERDGQEAGEGAWQEEPGDGSQAEAGMWSYEEELAARLEDFLRQVEGVGEVKVLIKTEGSQEKVVEKDRPLTQASQSETGENGSTRSTGETQQEESTVYEDTDAGQRPFVVKEYAPKIEGVVIAAEGAGNPEVAAGITDGVQALLQIEVHKIEVLKLKEMEEQNY